MITTVAPLSVAGALLPVLLLYGAMAWLVFTLIVWRHDDFVRPQLGALMTVPARRGARPIHLTPFGHLFPLHAGRLSAPHLMVSAALMTIALTIDLWPQVASVHAAAPLHVV